MILILKIGWWMGGATDGIHSNCFNINFKQMIWSTHVSLIKYRLKTMYLRFSFTRDDTEAFFLWAESISYCRYQHLMSRGHGESVTANLNRSKLALLWIQLEASLIRRKRSVVGPGFGAACRGQGFVNYDSMFLDSAELVASSVLTAPWLCVMMRDSSG